MLSWLGIHLSYSDFSWDQSGSWTAGNYSKFWGKPLSYGTNYKLGTKLPDQKQRALDPSTAHLHDGDIPTSYDFREDDEVKQFLRKHPIRDQGECNASWAFSTVGGFCSSICCLNRQSGTFWLYSMFCCRCCHGQTGESVKGKIWQSNGLLGSDAHFLYNFAR